MLRDIYIDYACVRLMNVVADVMRSEKQVYL